MCLEDVIKQRHRPKRRAGNIHQLLGLYPSGLIVALEIRHLTSRRRRPGTLFRMCRTDGAARFAGDGAGRAD
jgi:hypothetical protein